MTRVLALVAALAAPLAASAEEAVAYFAGGCFWCTEADFQKLDGVREAVSGYMGGDVPNPSYEQVVSGTTGHTEAVRVHYDPRAISYRELVAFHWRNIDPTAEDRQFCDRGSQYRSGIYYRNAEERAIAEASRDAIRERFEVVHTEIAPAAPFYEAESYHQDYAENNPLRYRFYRFNCGRDARLRELWGEQAGRLPEAARAP